MPADSGERRSHLPPEGAKPSASPPGEQSRVSVVPAPGGVADRDPDLVWVRIHDATGHVGTAFAEGEARAAVEGSHYARYEHERVAAALRVELGEAEAMKDASGQKAAQLQGQVTQLEVRLDSAHNDLRRAYDCKHCGGPCLLVPR